MNFSRQIGTFQIEEDPFSKGAGSIRKIYNEIILLMKFLRTKSQVRSMNISYYDM